MNIREFHGSYEGKTALVILGGTSASEWQELKKKVNPHVIMGANGVNSVIPDLDFWMCIENMNRTKRLAEQGNLDAVRYMDMFTRTGAKVRLVKSVSLLPPADDLVTVEKAPYFELDNIPKNFSFREYGEGYIKGGLMKHVEAIKDGLKICVGTVALQLLHHAGILGIKQVHTIGLDLCFKGGEHHFYQYPPYQPNVYFKKENFTTFDGLKTMWFWVESAIYLLGVRYLMNNVGMEWHDHSNGLLQSIERQHGYS